MPWRAVTRPTVILASVRPAEGRTARSYDVLGLQCPGLDMVEGCSLPLTQVRAGKTLIFCPSDLPHLSALIAFPVAFASLISGLILARPLRFASALRWHDVGNF
ncbi:hypothetical protein RCH23_001022 [Cryobacterium sp. CAN_C3]|nr:hypothetical protein [Cryobacterium sp. CAN_C3]